MRARRIDAVRVRPRSRGRSRRARRWRTAAVRGRMRKPLGTTSAEEPALCDERPAARRTSLWTSAPATQATAASPASSPLRSSEGSRAGVQILAPPNALGRRHLGRRRLPGLPSEIQAPQQRAALPHILRHDRDDHPLQRRILGDGGHVRAAPAEDRSFRAVARPSAPVREVNNLREVNNRVNPREPRSASTSVGRRFSGWN